MLLVSTSCKTGTSVALEEVTKGGLIPRGSWRRIAEPTEVTVATEGPIGGFLMQIDFDDAHAAERDRFHVGDSTNRRGHGPLRDRGHQIFHVNRRHACVSPDAAYNWNIDIRKDIDWHIQHRYDAEHRYRDGPTTMNVCGRRSANSTIHILFPVRSSNLPCSSGFTRKVCRNQAEFGLIIFLCA